MNLKNLSVLLAMAGLSCSAFATSGYFSHGYGIKSKGMAGVGIAYGQDALAAATNPANMVLVGGRWDVGVDYFRPQRKSAITGLGSFDGNDSENYLIPEFGYNRMISDTMSVGVSVYGNGGMATDYKDLNSSPAALGIGNLGVDLSQLFIAPTLSMKLNEYHAVGVSLKIAYQRFKAFGIQGICGAPMMSTSPTHCSNKGYDGSWGYGLGLGWTGQVTPTLSLGAVYQTRTYMQKFSKYKGLFAEKGDFDIPASYGVGMAWQATPALLVAADIQHMKYGSVRSIANKMLEGGPLGAENGAGFGWKDVTAYKLGISYDVSEKLTLRAGYSWNDEPYSGDETFFNILAPGVIKRHATLGATWQLAGGGELSLAYMHAFKNTIKGKGASTGISNTMYQDSLGIAYGRRF